MYLSPDQDPDSRSATVWERIEEQTGVDEVLQSRAAFELKRRLKHWNGDYLPRPTRFKNKHGINRGTHLVVPADPVELVIVRAVAMTRGAAQFGVSPNGAIFSAEGYGYTIRGPRVDVTRLSWLLDEAADILQQIRGGKGGRFYERDGQFFLADGKTTILEVVAEADPAERAQISGLSVPSRPFVQRVIRTFLRRHDEPESQLSPPTGHGFKLPEDIRRARQAPIRCRAVSDRDDRRTYLQSPLRADRSRAAGASRAQFCPKHFIELPANGRCDECRID